MGVKKFTCGDNISIFDIVLFNELSQVLFLYDSYQKSTKKDQADRHENAELSGYENINKWYTRTMTSDAAHEMIRAVDDELR